MGMPCLHLKWSSVELKSWLPEASGILEPMKETPFNKYRVFLVLCWFFQFNLLPQETLSLTPPPLPFLLRKLAQILKQVANYLR